MTDILDHAKELEMRQRQQAIEKALAHQEPEQQVINDQVFCIDCDSQIEPARLAAKPEAARCIHCQQLWELRYGR